MSLGRVEERDQLAWYLALTQMLGPWAGAARRVEQFSLDVRDAAALCTKVEPAALGFPSDDLRLVFSYARRLEDAVRGQRRAVVRVQAKYALP